MGQAEAAALISDSETDCYCKGHESESLPVALRPAMAQAGS
jgi:hypothetical protein